jgi:hypothetical protein
MYRPLFLVFTAAIWVTAGASAAAAPSDYLSDELRARVQTLKVDALIAPTDLVNVKSRLRTLWDWLNAYALSGGYVPVNATQSISQISAYPLTPTNNRFTTIDRMIQEFVLRDENPHALGHLLRISDRSRRGLLSPSNRRLQSVPRRSKWAVDF